MKTAGDRLRGLGAAAVLAVSSAACAPVSVAQGLPEFEANRAVAALDQAGIAAQKEAEEASGSGPVRFRVAVSADETARAVSVLQSQALPRREQQGFAETFAQGSLVPTATEERVRAGQALAGELARTLERVDGVLDARVHLSLPDAREAPLDGSEPARGSASVLLRYAGARAPVSDDAVKRLVAGAVAGLRAEDVSVVGVSQPAATGVGAGPNGEQRLAWVGPIAVARGSASALRGLVGVLLLLNVLLAGGVLFLVARGRRNAESAPTPGTPGG